MNVVVETIEAIWKRRARGESWPSPVEDVQLLRADGLRAARVYKSAKAIGDVQLINEAGELLKQIAGRLRRSFADWLPTDKERQQPH